MPLEEPKDEPKPKPPSDLPDPIEYLEFEVMPVEKPLPQIKDLFDGASRMIFGGAAKTYKSWGMCDLAVSLSAEVPWLDFETYFSPSLYVNFELKEYYFQKRLNAICAAKGVKLDKNALQVWNLRGHEIAFSSFIDSLSWWIEKTGRRSVFIDPFYKLLGSKDERISAEINPILLAFDKLNRNTGASIIASAHFAKGNQSHREPAERISGGGSLNRDPDALLTFSGHENKGEFVLDFTLRDHPPIDAFTTKWSHPLLLRCNSDPSKLKKPRAGKEEFDPALLLDLIADHDDQLGTEDLIKLASNDLAWARRTIINKLNQLKKDKKAYVSRITDNWNVKKHRSSA
jgi:hypothetical protein